MFKIHGSIGEDEDIAAPDPQLELDEDTRIPSKCHKRLTGLALSDLQLEYSNHLSAAAARIERQHSFNIGSAIASGEDMDFWTRAEFWTLSEAAALINGRNPQKSLMNRLNVTMDCR